MHLHGVGVGGPRRLLLAARLADRPDPVEILGLFGSKRDSAFELRKRLAGLAELEADLAKLAAKAGFVGRLLQQFEQQDPRDCELPGRDQRLNQVRPRRPVARIAPERLQVQRNGVLRHAAALMDDAEIAPARDEMGGETQGSLVVLGRGADVVAQHEGVGERGMEIGNAIDHGTDRDRSREREPGLEDRDRGPDLAAPVVLAPRA